MELVVYTLFLNNNDADFSLKQLSEIHLSESLTALSCDIIKVE